LRPVLFLMAVGTLHRLGASMRYAIMLFCGLLVAIAFAEMRSGASMRRYFTRSFLNDVLYGLFYYGGFYTLFVYEPIFNSIRPQLAIFDVRMLTAISPYAAVPLYFVVTDLFGYWIHRLQHTRYLWPFHSVHHTPRQLTYLTFSRFHLVDQFVANVAVYVPLLLLGAPPRLWLPVRLLQWFLQAIQHAELDWRLGPFYGVLAGPVFHSVHHSTEPRHFNKNFGMAFSFWDFLFGTAVIAKQRCYVYGVAGLDLPERISVQFTTPFRMLYSDLWPPEREGTIATAAGGSSTSHKAG
jgi:sterol desaturase/sphingolipid hydroxylase (fatty acid hydroxylase superfamily)